METGDTAKKSGGNKKVRGGMFESPKGMRDLTGEDYFACQGFFEKASEIALYYGFSPIETPTVEKEELFRSIGEYTDIVQKEMYTLRTKGGDKLALRPDGTAPVMRAYFEHGMVNRPQPVQLFYAGSFYRHERPQRGRWRQFRQFGLEVIGTDKSIADATVIKLFCTILEDVGLSNLVVSMNSLGDKDCRAAYRKALGAHFKRYASKLSREARETLKRNPLRLLDSKDPTVEPYKEGAPEAMEFLTGASKQHFREVLEYLDALSITYQIDSRLVRGLDYYNRTVFEIFTLPDEETSNEDEAAAKPLALGGGGRYDYLARAIGGKRDIPTVGGALGADRILELVEKKKVTPRVLKKPKVFFIQLGFEAKLKSLTVIEALRRARVPLRQSLSKDGLSTQLGIAERLSIPWVIILGQKEVMENSVIVRNMDDRSQKVVPIPELSMFIKQSIAK